MSKLKKIGAFVATALASVTTFAQEATGTIDLTAAGNAAGSISSAIKDLITGDVLAAVLVVIGAALSIWGVFLVVRWIRKGAK